MARSVKPKLSRGEAAAPGPGSELDRRLRTFARELDSVYRSLRRQGVGAVDAEDLAQDVFLIAWRRRADFDQSRPLRPWVAGIAFKLAHQHRRRRSREIPGAGFDPELTTELRPEALETRALVLQVLANLPERHRSVLVLHELDGLSVEQIAALWAVPRFTLYTRLRRARRAFVKEVERLQEPETVRRPVALAALLALAPPGAPPSPSPPPARLIPVLGAAACLCLALGLLVLVVSRPAAVPVGGAAATVARAHGLLPVIDRGPLRPVRLQLPPVPPPEPVTGLSGGLTGFWPFDDGPGSTTARDHSAGGRTCQLRDLDPASAWVPGVRGAAVELGFNGWIECPQPELPARTTAAVTVAAWIKRGGTPPLHRALAMRPSGGRGNYFFFGFGGDQLMISSTSWGGTLRAPFREPPGRWVHVAFTHEASHTVRLFVGGVEVARRRTGARPIAPVHDLLRVGAGLRGDDRTKIGQRFEGAIDDLRVYERALTEAEIRTLAAPPEQQSSL